MPGNMTQTDSKANCTANGTVKETAQKNGTNNSNASEPFLVWSKNVSNTELEKFKQYVENKHNLHFDSYWELHKWSVKSYKDFWEDVWHYLEVITLKPYNEVCVKTGDGFLDIDWFSGALFNYAENLMRIRDDRVALLYADELGNEDSVTFAEMFEEVKLYAAAFRKNGLQKGDRVACYMSNRKEAVFAMLAVTSIGAIWGGPQPYYGSHAAAKIVAMMEPKFLIAIDSHPDNKQIVNIFDNLSIFVESTPSLEKVIIVNTKEETLHRDISHIRNSCFLETFLQSGRTSDGLVPDIVFEQLPFSHPICINITSGTTGLPKGPVHSAGTLITHAITLALHWDLKDGDVLLSAYPVGWSLWDSFMPSLALGVTVFLYCGSPYYIQGNWNIWNFFSKYEVSHGFLVTSIFDKMEKLNIVPSENLKLEKLRMITIGGSPVKIQNYQFIHNKIKKDVFIGNLYGATETFGTFAGFDFNLPAYAKEVQVPGLGMDVRCFDHNGQSVVGQRGEMVLATPSPSLPIYLWKDVNNRILNEIYLSKYKGAWCQHDEIWINPITNGIVVIGRSDDTINQHGERFGSADIYFAIHNMEEILDYICVGQNRYDGDSRAVLFVKLKEGHVFTDQLKEKIAQKIYKELFADCVPQVILEAKDIPYNLNNKRMESVVRKIVATNQIPEVSNIRNRECLKYFCDIPELVNYNEK